MLNKVPEITVYFWVIKVLCTTVGETFADSGGEQQRARRASSSSCPTPIISRSIAIA
jgi:hypothetical protein